MKRRDARVRVLGALEARGGKGSAVQVTIKAGLGQDTVLATLHELSRHGLVKPAPGLCFYAADKYDRVWTLVP